MKISPTDPEANRKAIADFLSEQQSFYAGILDKVPEAFRVDLEKLKAGIEQKLAALASQPAEQMPAANAAANGLQQMAMALSWMREMYEGAAKGLQDLMERVTPKEQALHALEARLSGGELVEKAAAEAAAKEAVRAAVEVAVKAERDAGVRLSARRQMLASVNLPIPTDDTALAGEDAQFDARRAQAKARHERLVALGVSQQLDGAELAELVFGPEKDFERFVKFAGRGRQVAEPLAGGSNPDGQPKKMRGY